MSNATCRGIGRRQLLTVSTGGLLIATLPMPLLAQARPKHGRIDYGIASIDPLYAVAYVTMKRGFFQSEGLDVNYLNTQSGPRSKQLLAAGQLFITTTGVNDAIALSLAGKQATVVFGFDQRVPFANILVRKQDYDSGRVRSVKDLAGKTIAVTQPQAATWLMATYIADQNGIKNDVNIRGLGDFATMLAAVKSGQVDASIATISMIDSAVQQGWGHALFDVTDEKAWNDVFGGSVPGVGCYVLADSVRRRPEAIQAFVTAMAKGQEVLNESTPEQIVDLIFADFLTGYERPAALRAVQSYKRGLWNPTNDISPDSYRRLISIMGDDRQFSNAQLEKVPYERMVDMGFLKRARRA